MLACPQLKLKSQNSCVWSCNKAVPQGCGEGPAAARIVSPPTHAGVRREVMRHAQGKEQTAHFGRQDFHRGQDQGPRLPVGGGAQARGLGLDRVARDQEEQGAREPGIPGSPREPLPEGRRVRCGGPVRDRVPGAVQEVQEGPLDLQRAVPGLRAQALPPARPPAVLLQHLLPQVRGRLRAPHALLRRPGGRRAGPQEAL